MKKEANLFKTNRNLLILMVCLFAIMTGYGVLLPVLPFFVEKLLPQNSNIDVLFHFGILTAIYPISMVFTAPFWGNAADKIGPRPLIILGLGGFVIMQIMTGLSTSLFMLYIARIVGSVFSSFLLPVIFTNISSITNLKQRKKAIAWSGTAVSAGVIAGPSISGLLANNNLHLNFKIGHFILDGLSVPFFFLAIVGLLILFITVAFLEPVNKDKFIKNENFVKSLKLQWNLVGNLLVLSLIVQLSITLFETIFTIYGKEVSGYATSFISLGLFVCGLVMAVFQPVVAKWGGRVIKKESNQMVSGFILSGFALLLFLSNGQPSWVILVLISIFGIGNSLIVPNLITAVTLESPSSTGNALGLQFSFNGIGQIVGPLSGTVLYSINKVIPFFAGGLLLLIVAFYQINHLKKPNHYGKS